MVLLVNVSHKHDSEMTSVVSRLMLCYGSFPRIPEPNVLGGDVSGWTMKTIRFTEDNILDWQLDNYNQKAIVCWVELALIVPPEICPGFWRGLLMPYHGFELDNDPLRDATITASQSRVTHVVLHVPTAVLMLVYAEIRPREQAEMMDTVTMMWYDAGPSFGMMSYAGLRAIEVEVNTRRSQGHSNLICDHDMERETNLKRRRNDDADDDDPMDFSKISGPQSQSSDDV